MIVYFQSGQYFDPKIGWRSNDERNQKSEFTGIPVKEIDESMAYTIDEQLQEIIDRLKEQREARIEQMKDQPQSSESVGTDSSMFSIVSKYGIDAYDNKMVVTVNYCPSYYLSTSLSNYEEDRNKILNNKIGYCDEAINLLLKELDNKFASKMCTGLIDQLQGLNFKKADAEKLAVLFNEEYLRVRGSTGTIEGDAQKALKKIGLSFIDIYYGKPGHYGRLNNIISQENLEKYFKSVGRLDDWAQKNDRERPEPITLQTKGTITISKENNQVIADY